MPGAEVAYVIHDAQYAQHDVTVVGANNFTLPSESSDLSDWESWIDGAMRNSLFKSVPEADRDDHACTALFPPSKAARNPALPDAWTPLRGSLEA